MLNRNRFPMIITLLAVYFNTIEAATLHGVVHNAAGQPLAGAQVTLEKGKQKTTSGSDGSFTLDAAVSLLSPSPRLQNSLVLRGESFTIDLSGAANSTISVFTLQGRKVAEVTTPTSGTQMFHIQPPGRGMYVYQVSNNFDASGIPGKLAKSLRTSGSTGSYGDILRVEMHGFITNRRAVAIPDTSTIIINMIACIDS